MAADRPAAKYTLLKRVAVREATTYHAVDAEGGPVMVHFLRGGASDERAWLFNLLGEFEPADRASVLEVAEVGASTVVVTRPLEGFDTLGDWLETRVRAREAEAKAAPPGEFTRRFGPAAEEAGRPAVEPEEAAGPGEFTRRFGPASEDAGPPSVEPEEAAAPGRVTEERGAARPTGPAAGPGESEAQRAPPGEFTRQFGPPPQPADRGQRIARSSEAGAQPTERPVAEAAAKPSGAAPDSEADQAPGEFTRLFGSGAAAPPTRPDDISSLEPPASAKPPLPDTADYLRALDPSASAEDDAQALEAWPPDVAPTPPSATPPHSPPPTPAAPLIPQGPSEYTRVVSAAPAPGPQAPLASGEGVGQPPTASGPGAPSLRVLLLGLGIVLIVAVSVTLCFALT